MSFRNLSIKGPRHGESIKSSEEIEAVPFDGSESTRLHQMRMHHVDSTSAREDLEEKKHRWYLSLSTPVTAARQSTSEKTICSSFLQTHSAYKPQAEVDVSSDCDEVARSFREATLAGALGSEITPEALLEQIDADWKQACKIEH